MAPKEDLDSVTNQWLQRPYRVFSRAPQLTTDTIACDCSGFMTLLFQHLAIPTPYKVTKARAVHYFNLLQEIGSNHIEQLQPGHVLAWRKERVPKTGDSGHVLLTDGAPLPIKANTFQLDVIDATKKEKGLARRKVLLQTSDLGHIIGVQLHDSDTKMKRTPIYHAPLLNQRYCWGCGLPQKVCMCAHAMPSNDEPNLVILRHPQERRKTLATVSLIKQRYPSLYVKDGTSFDPIRAERLAVVFPGGEPFAHPAHSSAGKNTLIVLDATWRKAKRMLHENPWLAALPRISITPTAVSDYLLRKVPNGDALSTVETMAVLQQDVELTKLFGVFMKEQIDAMGHDRYLNNYKGHVNYRPETNDIG